jgi:hypothetical protein
MTMHRPAHHVSGQGDPATVIVGRAIHPGKERAFDAWAHQIDVAARRFPGHLGNVRLRDPRGIDYLIYRFDSPAHLRAWEASEERRKLIERGNEISDENRNTAIGMDAWFAISGQSVSPKWKTFLVTWVAVYPILLLIAYALAALFPGLARPLQLAITSALLTASLTWVVMPRLTKLLRPWLLKGQSVETRR